MLFLVPTPIGNLSDITLRALDTLKRVSYILAEDTRTSQHLLNHFSIHTPLVSYHKHNEVKMIERVLRDLQEGKEIALISDAGTPGINDPGSLLIKTLHEHHLPFTPLPGACSVITAISASGVSDKPFQFLGFFPHEKRAEFLLRARKYDGLSVFFLAPHDAADFFEFFTDEDRIGIARELTKLHEEIAWKSISEWKLRHKERPLRGELVVLIEGRSELLSIDPVELVEVLETTFSLSSKEAIKIAAELLVINKQQLYKTIHKK